MYLYNRHNDVHRFDPRLKGRVQPSYASFSWLLKCITKGLILAKAGKVNLILNWEQYGWALVTSEDKKQLVSQSLKVSNLYVQ